MLRIAVISLVVANVLLLGFEASKPRIKTEAVSHVVKTGSRDIPTIHLFNELMQDQALLSGNGRCFTLGPFHDIEDMQTVRQRVDEVSLYTYDRQTEAMVEKGYWVFLRPYRSLLEANERLFALQGLGLKDVAVIYEGDFKNSISLGYFLRQENAVKRQRALEAEGYEPLIRVQRQAEPRYWLDYEQSPGSGIIALNMQDRPNDFMQRSLPCPQKAEMTDMAQTQFPVQEDEPESVDLPESAMVEGSENVAVDRSEAGPAQMTVTESETSVEDDTEIE